MKQKVIAFFTWLLLVSTPSLAEVVDLGQTDIQGKRESPEVYFILGVSSFDVQQEEISMDVLDHIEEETYEDPF